MAGYNLFKPNIYIGIDQTGALQSNGSVKALPCSIIRKTRSGLDATVNISLKNLDLESVSEFINYKDLHRTLIIVDSVLGIPYRHTTNKPLRTLFKEASKFKFDNKSFGAQTAHKFFNTIVRNQKFQGIPTRQAETIANANSIFRLKPFQRNIGCGTFRIWKNLSADQNWYSLWPAEKYVQNTCTIAEGYPSLLWKTFIRSKRGEHSTLIDFAKKNNCKIKFSNTFRNFKSTDDMDSFVLALFAALNTHLIYKINSLPSVISKEGWIFGLQ